jgi:YaiO family outer membrane protein
LRISAASMTGIYPDSHWYNRAATVIIRLVQSLPRAVAVLLVAVASTAVGQGDPERPGSVPATRVGFDYSYSTFGGTIDPWHLGAFSVETRRPQGSFIARVNLAKHFATVGAQYEVDAYPALGKGRYLYLNAGYSRATIFPEQRYGAEIFTALPHANEASLGVRSLSFLTERVTLLTGSLGRYTGNYWLSLRPFVQHKSAGGLSSSASLTARRYYADADTYIGARIGAGSAPTDAVDPSQLARENSMTFGLQASRPGSPRTVTTWMFNYERDKNPVRTLKRWEFGAGMKVRF